MIAKPLNLDIFRESSEIPGFDPFIKDDVNPLSGHDKTRVLYAPNDPMRRVHARVIHWVRALPGVDMSFATGALPGCSPLKNAKRHETGRFFYGLDVHGAYEHVDPKRLAKVLAGLDLIVGGEDAILAFLSEYCLRYTPPRLVQVLGRKYPLIRSNKKKAIRAFYGQCAPVKGLATGAPASPDLFNLFCAVLIDTVVGEVALEEGLTYTRYLDDLVISSRSEPLTRRVKEKIRAAVLEAGFAISHRKSFSYDLRLGPVTITGVRLRWSDKGTAITFLERNYFARIRKMIRAGLQGAPVHWNKLNGMMGAFWSATCRGRLTRREVRLLQDLHELRKLYKRGGLAA